MASPEVVVKFTYASSKGSKTFTKLSESLTKQVAAESAKNYAKIVDGELTAAQYKTVEDLDIGN